MEMLFLQKPDFFLIFVLVHIYLLVVLCVLIKLY